MARKRNPNSPRNLALRNGDVFFEGNACSKHPDNTKRYAINGHCVICCGVNVKAWRVKKAAAKQEGGAA